MYVYELHYYFSAEYFDVHCSKCKQVVFSTYAAQPANKIYEALDTHTRLCHPQVNKL